MSFIERIDALRVKRESELPYAEEREAARQQRASAPPDVFGHFIGPRTTRPPRPGCGIPVDTAAYWLGQVGPLVRAANILGYDDEEGRRSYMYACRLLGVSWMHVEKAVGDSLSYGAAEAAKFWAPHMRPADDRLVGFVYVALASRHPGFLKIGFSRKPEKRMRSLTRQHGTEVMLRACHPGTMLHEWAIHQLLRHLRVAPEWYRWDDVPGWLHDREIT